jgi:type I restriction enzyme R subunit
VFPEKYIQQDAWISLGILDVVGIKEHIPPLVIPYNEVELAKRFDYLMFTIEFAKLTKIKANKAKDNVVKTAVLLSKIGTIPQVLSQKEIIAKVQTDHFWEQADIFDYEMVREALRDLIKFIEKEQSKIYYTNFTDEILNIKEAAGEYSTNSLQSYRKKVSTYLMEHKDHISIHKLRFNKQLTKQDFLELERLLLKDIGTKEDYVREFGDTPLTILVRQIVGLDQEAANEAFSEFLNDENLNSKQINFVKRIVDYVVKNGHMQDKSALQEEPFESLGSITELFPTEKAFQIVSVIDRLNRNAMDILEATEIEINR